jgi:putative membrane protein (TIGR04086 family)
LALIPSLDLRAICTGMGIALAIAVPAALISQLFDSGDSTNAGVVAVTFLAVLIGFGVGGYVAAQREPDAPLAHGAIAALAAFVLVQAIGVIRRSVAGDDIHWLTLPFNALLAAALGALGGLFANRRHAP